jgi:hypothetical protein
MPHQNFASCIRACYACAEACNHCAAACLQEQDVKMMAHCIALDRSSPTHRTSFPLCDMHLA